MELVLLFQYLPPLELPLSDKLPMLQSPLQVQCSFLDVLLALLLLKPQLTVLLHYLLLSPHLPLLMQVTSELLAFSVIVSMVYLQLHHVLLVHLLPNSP